MSRIPFLPHWVLPPTFPSVYDSESATCTEMTSKVYGAMQKLIEDYNNFADHINKEIETFTGSSAEEISDFKKSIEQRLICKFKDMDARLNEIKAGIPAYADQKIADIYDQYLNKQISQLINEKIASGEIDITLVYDPVTESLNMSTGG